jgi:NitT/TauT family transport system ATP-binding protein
VGATAYAPKIKVRGVQRHFGLAGGDPVHALGPIDLEIGEGEFVCIVGPSGCGKSTLLRVIGGLVPPTSGEVEIAVASDSRQATSMVFQNYGIYPWKTVERNVTFGLEVAGVPLKQARERAAHWLERLGLADFARAWPDTLSGGMRQRVAIARALVVEPEILLMDEPFAALDAQLRQLLQEELLALWEAERRTVVFVTHSLEEAAVLGDRVDVMSARPGRLLKSVEVPFERPRHGEIRARKEFNEFRNDLWELLRGEVEAQFAARRQPMPAGEPHGEQSRGTS